MQIFLAVSVLFIGLCLFSITSSVAGIRAAFHTWERQNEELQTEGDWEDTFEFAELKTIAQAPADGRLALKVWGPAGESFVALLPLQELRRVRVVGQKPSE